MAIPINNNATYMSVKKRQELREQDLWNNDLHMTNYNHDQLKDYFTRTLSLGKCTDKDKLLDLYRIWCAYMHEKVRVFKKPDTKTDKMIVTGPSLASVRNLTHQIERHDFETAYGTGEMTPGVQLVQDAIDEGVLEALDAYMEHGLSAADLIAGRAK